MGTGKGVGEGMRTEAECMRLGGEDMRPEEEEVRLEGGDKGPEGEVAREVAEVTEVVEGYS